MSGSKKYTLQGCIRSVLVRRTEGDKLHEALRMCWAQGEGPIHAHCDCWFVASDELCHADLWGGYYPQLQ